MHGEPESSPPVVRDVEVFFDRLSVVPGVPLILRAPMIATNTVGVVARGLVELVDVYPSKPNQSAVASDS